MAGWLLSILIYVEPVRRSFNEGGRLQRNLFVLGIQGCSNSAPLAHAGNIFDKIKKKNNRK